MCDVLDLIRALLGILREILGLIREWRRGLKGKRWQEMEV